MTTRAFVDSSGVERLVGTLVPDPGGSQPLAVTKYSFPFSFTVGGVPIQDDWLTFATVTAGTVLLAWRGFVTATWNAGGKLTVNDAPAGAGTNVFRTGQNLQTYGAGATAIGDAVTETGFYWATGTSLSVTTDAAAASGNLDLYLLTYTPA